MILANYNNFKRAVYSNMNYTSARLDVSSFGIKKTNGNVVDYIFFTGSGSDGIYARMDTAFLSGISLVVGTGSADPNYTDYALGTDATSSFSFVSSSVAYNINQDNKFEITYTATIQNTSGNDITLSEYGITKKLYNTSAPDADIYTLILKDKMNNFTIPANGIAVIVVKWTE